MIASNWYIWLSWNLVYILQVTVRQILLILVNIGWIVFLQEYKKNSYTLRSMESNSLKFSSIQMVRSTELKFSMYIIRHCPTHFVEFGEFRINSFFTGTQKRILMHYSLRSQIIRSMLVSKRCFRLSSSLAWTLKVTIGQTLKIWWMLDV